MADKKAAAAAAKARGNTAFTSGDFQKGIDEFTVAIDNDPTDHVFFSNRSACYASLNKYAEALKDANECVRLKPDWPKGYSRQGVAFFNLKQLDEAKGAYEKGVSLEPANQATKDALAQVNGAIEAAKRPPPNPMGKLFGPDMWGKLQANPTTREYLKDEAFVAKMKMMQSNPSLLSSLGSDPKLSTAIGVILGIDLSARGGPAGADEDAEMDARNAPPPASAGAAAAAAPASSPSASSKPATPSGNVHIGDDEDDDEEMPAAKKADEKKPAAAAAPAQPKAEAPKPEVKETKDQKSANLNKEAEDEKVKGNDFYKKKQFDEAIKHYEKAQEIDPKNATYVLNTTAALLESKQYEKCNDLCRRGIEIAQTNMAGFEIVAKFYLRLGNSYMATKNYGDAVSSFNKSLLEQSSDKARQLLKKATELKKQADELAYQDKGKSLEAKERGNKLFTDGKFIDAIPEYTEAIRRDPTNPALYSNRAGCYTKVMDWARALEDCEKALSLDPNFVKVYIRKAKIQHLLKQYKKAMETYDAGLKLDPKASELIEGRMATMRAIRQSSQSGQADPERLKEAMRDPEIRGILNDMTMQKVLKDLQENPAAANAAMADKDIRANIEKLIAAGVLSVG